MDTNNAGRHLLAADDALDEARRWGYHLTLCGVVLPVSALPPAECPPGCEGTGCLVFCPACVAEAAGRNAELLAEAVRS
jgi:hypothetical protein